MKSKWLNRLFIQACAVLIVAVWGMTFISTKVLLNAGLDPVNIFAIRFALAYVGILVFELGRALRMKTGLKVFCDSVKDEAACVLAGMMGGSLYFVSENSALVYTQASSVSFIVCTTPLVTALLFSALTRKVPGKWLICGSFLALAGVGMIAFGGEGPMKVNPKGDLLALGASLTWAIYTLTSNKLLKKYDSALITRKVFFYGLLTILPVVLAKDGVDIAVFADMKVSCNLLFLSLVASLGCYMGWNIIIKRLGAIESSNYIYLNPLFTLMGAIIILGEQLTACSAIGCLLTLLGVWVADNKKIKFAG